MASTDLASVGVDLDEFAAVGGEDGAGAAAEEEAGARAEEDDEIGGLLVHGGEEGEGAGGAGAAGVRGGQEAAEFVCVEDGDVGRCGEAVQLGA